jgi:hypothetical protein
VNPLFEAAPGCIPHAELQLYWSKWNTCKGTNTAVACEHTFDDVAGTPLRRFRHALATGNARIAEAAARDLQHVGLADALELVLLYRDDPERYERAAARWIGRLVAERPRLRLSEVELASAAFREALHSDRGVSTLHEKLL